MKITLISFVFLICAAQTIRSQEAGYLSDKHRPQFHFSPKKFWMNDPNGLIYHNGTYHLFFQHFPEKTVWGPMHWGHATSTDLLKWTEQPIALYPDKLGWIFSGSAVMDFDNTTGFGKNGKPPMIAIFTHHNDSLEKLKGNNHQYQSLAFSNDEGKTWTKYARNPVLKNPGIADFRDPKVMWYDAGKMWIMTLATKDRITFYASADLKNWKKQSEFGQAFGAHGGVWECPDLFQLPYGKGSKWVLLVSINPGGPNGGSVTQYFTGDFDGKTFKPTDTITRWMDYGPDNYAGVTFSNTGSRHILLGWMSNWQYANQVPTTEWRSAMTIPRELSLVNINQKAILVQKPVMEINRLQDPGKAIAVNAGVTELDLNSGLPGPSGLYRLSFDTEASTTVSVTLSNSKNQQVVIGFDPTRKEFFIDRTTSGAKGFSNEFFKRSVAPRISNAPKLRLDLIIDHASVELFADDGTTVMTAIFFPDEVFSKVMLQSPRMKTVTNVQIANLRSPWKAGD